MKKSLLFTFAIATLTLTSCMGEDAKKSEESSTTTSAEAVKGPEAVDDEAIDSSATEADHIVISKKTLTLKVYDKYNRLICKYPIAAGRVFGKKQANGDLKTPEGEFRIGVIQDASNWTSIDNNGKSIQGARGPWFMHLDGGEIRGMGICGTLDPSIVGTRSSEGNIILRNEDLLSLKEIVSSNMPITILPADADLLADGIVIEKSEEKEAAATTTETKKETKKTASGVTDENGNVWHTIAKGEVLSKIADNYGTTVNKIQALNPGLKADKIREGQRIKVYGSSEATTTAVTKQVEEKKETPAGEVWHTIARGELVSKIAANYGTSTKKIAELNPDINIDRVREGQKIRVK